MSKPSGRAEAVVATGGAQLSRVVVSGLFLVPFLVNLVGQILGFEIFYVADPKVQIVWGTLAQLVGGLPLYRLAVRHLGEGGQAAAFWAAALSTAIYLTSLYTALLRPQIGTFFNLSALLIFAHFTVQWMTGRRRY